ncbi:hypothetical protein O9H85_37220, partial [Paenibacillus filicis]
KRTSRYEPNMDSTDCFLLTGIGETGNKNSSQPASALPMVENLVMGFRSRLDGTNTSLASKDIRGQTEKAISSVVGWMSKLPYNYQMDRATFQR